MMLGEPQLLGGRMAESPRARDIDALDALAMSAVAMFQGWANSQMALSAVHPATQPTEPIDRGHLVTVEFGGAPP